METLINEHGTIMDKYDPAKRVGLILDEWGTWYEVEKGTNPGFLYQQNTIRDALVAGIHLNIFNNHCDRVRMANIAQVANVLQAPILTRGAEMILTPTYHVFDMYSVHQDAELIESRIECAGYGKEKEAALTEEIPCINGSVSERDGCLNVSLCNLDHANAHEIECTFFGKELGATGPASAATVTGRVLTGDAIDARNTFEKPAAIVPNAFTGFSWKDGKLAVKLPARSVVTLIIKN
jgi:alpha-N-arabinofuranosidase